MQEIKLPLCAGDTIVYIDEAKGSIRKCLEKKKEKRKCLEIILEMSKCTGYTMNIPNSVVFLQTSMEHTGTKMKYYNATYDHLKKDLAVTRRAQNYTLETVLC